mmetsp:Transcript_97094/g.172839  ORF Transcript_97094/g.172839 Transcript_97094/m.172839 type:complete len:453 (-) Transcript_97094:152-1510(-)
MFCCRRRWTATVDIGIDAEIARWLAAAEVEAAEVEARSHGSEGTAQVEAVDGNTLPRTTAPPVVALCPICFDDAGDKVGYVEVSTHSWENSDRCDGHDICHACLQRYVEIKLVEEAVWNIRCPGEACQYHLLQQDLEMALAKSELRNDALTKHDTLRSEDCGSRLGEVLAALQDTSQEWLWNECQVCPNCLVLARREDGCDHLACRCGTHFCWRCGADYNREGNPCCCDEYGLYEVPRSFLCFWLCFKHDNHPAIGDWRIPVREKLTLSLPSIEQEQRRAERRRAEAERARLEMEAEAEWARAQVTGTTEALEIRSRLESLGLHLWHAGADVHLPMPEVEQSFQGLLVSNTTDARENNDDDWDLERRSAGPEFEYEEPEPPRTHMHRRRMVRVKAWLAAGEGTRLKEKAIAKAPAHPRRQKQAIVASSRKQVAQARELRRASRAARLQVNCM